MKIPIIYEDEHVLVIDKPAGLLVHASGLSGKEGKTLVDWLVSKYPDIAGVGEDLARPGIVHRLDRDTSGVLIVAKDRAAFRMLKRQFKDRAATKTYRAITEGVFKEDRGIIDRPIGKSRSDVRARVASAQARGTVRDALTYYKVLERFPAASATYVEFYPKTGRTHQIRVHAKAVGHPIAGDELYRGAGVVPAPRHMLHAASLEIEIPDLGRKLFESPLPKDFTGLLDRLRT